MDAGFRTASAGASCVCPDSGPRLAEVGATMVSAPVEATLRRRIAHRLSLSQSDIQRASRFDEDLGADSLAWVEIVEDAEYLFGVELDEDGTIRIPTFGELVDLVSCAVDSREALERDHVGVGVAVPEQHQQRAQHP